MKITEKRMEELLPQNIQESELSLGTKKVLSALLDWYLNSEARNTGVVIISNKKLCAIACVSADTLQSAIRDIDEYGLGRREVGTGLKNASKYYLDFEALTKPLKRKTFFDLFSLKNEEPKNAENPIEYYSIVQDSIVENSIVKNSIEQDSKEKKSIEQGIIDDFSIEEKPEPKDISIEEFVKEIGRRGGYIGPWEEKEKYSKFIDICNGDWTEYSRIYSLK